jgi:hypothetical protein
MRTTPIADGGSQPIQESRCFIVSLTCLPNELMKADLLLYSEAREHSRLKINCEYGIGSDYVGDFSPEGIYQRWRSGRPLLPWVSKLGHAGKSDRPKRGRLHRKEIERVVDYATRASHPQSINIARPIAA